MSTAPDRLQTALSTLDGRTIAVGYSGGVDSALLAVAAADRFGRDRVLAILGRSRAVSAEQMKTAREIAQQFAIPILEIDTDELDDPRYTANPTNRCYYCKAELWSKVVPAARDRGYAVVADGTNADDLGDYRPGAAAAAEWGIVSPLADATLTKADVRDLARSFGIPVWDKPSSPCLASRIAYGTSVTPDRLARVERAERNLRAIGIAGDLRVRDHDRLARVEISRAELATWLTAANRRAIADAVRDAGYARVTIDLRGYRSGGLNVLEGIRVA
jgi:uncharacterized protein